MNATPFRKLPVLRWSAWAVTHLLALGAGWWLAGERSPVVSGAEESTPIRSSGREPRRTSRVPVSELIGAYGNSEYWSESQARRPGAAILEIPVDKHPRLTPEQRAAETKDIPAAIQKELEALNAGKIHDYMFAKALVTRWMKEDAKACAAWLGRMESRIGWMDPFQAFAASRPPMEVLDLMDDGWLSVNRRRAMESLARQVGESSAASLPDILERLGGDLAKGFLETASRYARPEDAALWLQLAGDDQRMLADLAYRWIQTQDVLGGPPAVPDEAKLRQAESLLALAEGTPAAELFRARVEEQRRNADGARLLALAGSDPKQAFPDLVRRAMDEGRGEEEATKIACDQIRNALPGGLAIWQKGAWLAAIQHNLSGKSRLDEVLGERLDAIRANLPDPLQSVPRIASFGDALAVDPAATLEFARDRGLLDEVVRGGADKLGQNSLSASVRAEILAAFAREGLWTTSRGLPDPRWFADEYARYDPEAAKAWMAGLPQIFKQPQDNPPR